jgi:hypothetical protein
MDILQPERLLGSWKREGKDAFISSPIGDLLEQITLFPETQSDYTITLDVTLETKSIRKLGEAGVIVRYTGEDMFYYAGIGGFGSRIFIGVSKRHVSRDWQCLACSGRNAELVAGNAYQLRVECMGASISLYENEATRLYVEDHTYLSGGWGLRAVGVKARFSNITVGRPGRPRFGSARGMFTMSDDFDAPLEDFGPYER